MNETRFLFMEVTKDELELPVAVADSLNELARMRGIRPSAVWNCMDYAKRTGNKSKYIKVEVIE